MSDYVLAVLLIFIAGFIDSVVGGGGLITVPTLALYIPHDVEVIATNKILGVSTALTAFFIYWRKTTLNQSAHWRFVVMALVGSTLGSFASPYFPDEFVKYFLIIVAPPLLYFTFNNDFWKSYRPEKHTPTWVMMLIGGLIGFYDGCFGPGGGLLMFVSLYWGFHWSLPQSLLVTKLTNAVTAGSSLLGYAVQGWVHWDVGLKLSGYIIVGSIVGASVATVWAQKIVRPVLCLIVIGLIIRLWY